MVTNAQTEMPAPTRPGPPTEASPGRRLIHLGIAVGGWVLFVYWWLVVLRRVSPEQVRFTGIFIAVTVVVVVAITALWAIHNVRLFQRKGPRTHVREAKADYTRDRLGRNIHFTGPTEALTQDPVVLIRLEHEGKTYRPSSGARKSESLPFPIQSRIGTHEPR